MASITSLIFLGLTSQFLYLQGVVTYPMPSQREPCDHPFDLMLILDSSGSVVPTWNNTIDFTEKLLSHFNISDDVVRVGIIEFSMVANALIPLDSGNTLGRLYQALEEVRISPQNGETHTDKALYLAASIFRASPRAYTVPRVLVIMTDGELTSGNFSDLDAYIADLSSQSVETFVVVQGDYQIDEGLKKIANSQDFNHIFSLTPNSMYVPHAAESLTRAICNAKLENLTTGDTSTSDVKIQQSTTIIQNVGRKESQESQQQGNISQLSSSSTYTQGDQSLPFLKQTNFSTQSIDVKSNDSQALYKANASYQNLQQPIGRPKQVYPESTWPQPFPSIPVTENWQGNASDSSNSSNKPLIQMVNSCNLNITKVSCCKDLGITPRPLPVLIMEEKGNNFEKGVKNEMFDKKAWQDFLPEFLCKCANKIRERGWWTLGIQNYNECYSGPDEGRYDEDGEAKQGDCIDENLNICGGNSQYCSGTSRANYIYTIVTPSHKDIVKITYE